MIWHVVSFFKNLNHLRDGLVTIPKAVVHLVVDSLILVPSLALGLSRHRRHSVSVITTTR